MLCDPGCCNCFHYWGDSFLNLYLSHANTCKHTAGAKNIKISFLFSWMQSMTWHTKLFYTPHNRTEVCFFLLCFGGFFLHEMLLCKTRGAANCLSKCCQQYDVSKNENLDEKLLDDVWHPALTWHLAEGLFCVVQAKWQTTHLLF